jgi:hypothetical protein
MHIGDLDGARANQNSNWSATVTITVHDGNHAPVAGAVVNAAWTGGATGSVSCTTLADGQCSVTKGGIKKNQNSVTFTVSGVMKTGVTYQPSANHDPDTDSNGTAITVLKP